MSSETSFDVLNKISVAGKTDQKGRFTYLSWVYAWSEMKKYDNEASVKVYENENGLPYFADGDKGVIVKVGVICKGIEHISYLPCMDYSNKAKKADKVDMMDVNKAVQRATVKAIALHGIGLYIYAGEDLPEDDSPKKPELKTKTASKPKEDKPVGSGFKRKAKVKPEEKEDNF